MTRTMTGFLSVAAVFAFAGVAWADDEAKTGPIPAERQARLLERFGDQGIDADQDGALTREEVQAFFEEKHGGDDWEGFGHRGKGRHQGFRGKEGRRGGRMLRLGMALLHLDKLSEATPPAEFDLAKHAEADLDGDGQLSESEWQAFAEQERAEILADLAQRMPGADQDKDGTLNAEELETAKARFREHLLAQHPDADTDGDGVLSPEEAKAFFEVQLEAHRALILEAHPEADLDGDGILSDQEMHAVLADKPGRGGPGCMGGQGRGGPRSKGNRGPGCGRGRGPQF